MKKLFCPKCDNNIPLNESKYKETTTLVFVCPACAHAFKVHIANKTKDEEEIDFSLGFVRVLENSYAHKQEFPLVLGDNVIGRRNKGTDNVQVPIITSDPSMGRKHCVINVKRDKEGGLIYTLRDFPSLTGTFLRSTILAKKEQARIEPGAVATIGATTFILCASEKDEQNKG